MKRTINEAQLRAVVSKNLNKFLNEGIPWEWDGKYIYQGTGSKESKERVKKMQDKTNKDWYTQRKDPGYLPSMQDKNGNDRKRYETGRCLRDFYSDDRQHFKETTYWILNNLRRDIIDILDDFRKGYSHIHFEPETEELIEDIYTKVENLPDTSKRDWAGREDY